jgi:glycosyltransferase involved in cell wall biosynthesis
MSSPALRVAHVLRKYDPDQWGGTETHVVEITRHLGATGCRSEVMAPLGPTAPDRRLAPDVPLARYRAACPFIAPADRRAALVANGGNLLSVELPLRLARDAGLSLAHAHTLGRIGGCVRAAMRWTGRPYVVSIHGPLLSEPVLVANETQRRLEGTVDLGRPFGALVGARRVLDDAARVIVFNEDERRAVATRVGDRAVRMDHGVDPHRYASGDAKRADARWPSLGDGPVVALVGRVTHQKNQMLAVRALSQTRPLNTTLVFAGAETDRGVRVAVDEEARALGVADRVKWLGNVASDAVPDLLARADVVLVPSTHEAFGLAVLEAWAAGRPCLFAETLGLRDLGAALGPIAGPEACVPSYEPAVWGAQLSTWLSDPARRRTAADAGGELVRARYRWDVIAARLTELYRSVLEARVRGAA